jgi:hypothetical protein
MKFDASILINRPMPEIFELLHDYDKSVIWDPFLREAKSCLDKLGLAVG